MEKEIHSDFLEVSRGTGIPVKKVFDMFYFLSSGEPIANNELLRKVGISRNVLNQVKKALSSYLRPSAGETSLKQESVSGVQSLYSGDYKVEEALWEVTEGIAYKKAVELLEKYQERRPTPRREYDQFTATIETAARRVSLIDFFGDVKGKRVLFLGDNDFTSIAVASLREEGSITAVDIDERILEEINNVSQEQSFDIKTSKYDARERFPDELSDRFDVVFTDPPYTLRGIKLFVSRAVEALDKNNQAGRIYVCYGNSDRAKERFLPIYEALADSGLMMRWIFDKFNRYYGAESIGSSSSLFICESTPKTKPLIRGNYDVSIYTNN